MSDAVLPANPLPRGSLRDFLALTKPGITRMAAFAAAGTFIVAPGHPTWRLGVAALVGITGIVAAANTLNQHAERESDRLMERTRLRPLPDLRMAPRAALVFGIILTVLSLALLAACVNMLTAALGLLALVIYLAIYTPLKRRTPAALLIGAVPGAMPVLMGWTSATNHLDASGLALFGILFMWQIPHFIAISVYRQAEYEAAGLRIVPSVRGLDAARRETFAYTLALLPISLAPVLTGLAGMPYLIVASMAGLMLVALSAVAWREGTTPAWAWRYFRGTLAYIPAIGAALALDGFLR